jgi:hypothetical protein
MSERIGMVVFAFISALLFVGFILLLSRWAYFAQRQREKKIREQQDNDSE